MEPVRPWTDQLLYQLIRCRKLDPKSDIARDFEYAGQVERRLPHEIYAIWKPRMSPHGSP